MEHFISKLNFTDDGNLIDNFCVHDYDETGLSAPQIRQRPWLIARYNAGYSISGLTRDTQGQWVRMEKFTCYNGLFSWGTALTQNLPSRKAFVSYHHRNDEPYRRRFENLFEDLVISKSVNDGEIDSENSADYIKSLIQNKHLSDTTVLIVLLGAETQKRKHVDWEISGGLNLKVGGRYAGILGLFLPTHPNYGSDTYTPSLVPNRLAANFKSQYAIARDWTDDRITMQKYIESAFARRERSDLIINAAIPQMQRNGC